MLRIRLVRTPHRTRRDEGRRHRRVRDRRTRARGRRLADGDATSRAWTLTLRGDPRSRRTSATRKSRANQAGPAVVCARRGSLFSGFSSELLSTASHSVHDAPVSARTEKAAAGSPSHESPIISASRFRLSCWTNPGAIVAARPMTCSWTPGFAVVRHGAHHRHDTERDGDDRDARHDATQRTSMLASWADDSSEGWEAQFFGRRRMPSPRRLRVTRRATTSRTPPS